ncbi:CRISPR-associated endonuclease Cas1 [Catenulispora pinisilvae]|uniref:CRISPR-associated endonuclease Cas1 n=1 Tax=Catenulispora pinisilvae TaxID=2705253 RepID=UPI0018926D96|nr:CRISPR-associated endonuclease Cas1 [Catenulispora pinisilvae]
MPWTRREYQPGDAFAKGDDVNRVLSAANAALYGICHAVTAGIGVSPALGFVHTGSAVSFVLDIADLYKAEYTIPLAFDLAAAGQTTERDARLGFRQRVADGKLLGRIVRDVKLLLTPAGENMIEVEENTLWGDADNTVAGGTNWAGWDESVLDEGHYLSVVGPLFEPDSGDGTRS